MLRTKRNPLVYSEEFKKLVHEAHPDNGTIEFLLNENSYELGVALDFYRAPCATPISLETIIEMIKNGHSDELVMLAEEKLEKNKIEKLQNMAFNLWDEEVFLD